MKFSTLITSILLTTFGFGTLQATANPESPPKWNGYLDISAFPGADGTLERTDLFVPALQNANTLSFMNWRHELDEDGWYAFSAGLGLRHRVDSWIVGAYGFIDWRETDFSGKYRQLSFGAELMHQHWDLRFNAYLPDDNQTNELEAEAVGDAARNEFYDWPNRVET